MEDKALLVIDVQESFKARAERWALRNNPRFEENVTALLTAWRGAGQPVFFVLHTDGDPFFRPGDPEVRLMDFIERRDDEPLLTKTTFNAFTSTNLKELLDAKNVRNVAVIGISTEQCCETTARVAHDVFGYEVDFVTEATATFPIGELSPDEVARRTEAALNNRFARVVTVQQLAAELAEVTASAT